MRISADKSRHLQLHERIAILEKLAIRVESEHESFAMTIAQEGGKPLRDARLGPPAQLPAFVSLSPQ